MTFSLDGGPVFVLHVEVTQEVYVVESASVKVGNQKGQTQAHGEKMRSEHLMEIENVKKLHRRRIT